MDFIIGLPKSQGKEVIFVVVDHLTEYDHFFQLAHPYTASDLALVFMNGVYKHHGLLQSIVSGKDPLFLSHLWKEFFKLKGVALHHSTTFHLQTDRQSEVVNRSLECYLCCMTGDLPK